MKNNYNEYKTPKRKVFISKRKRRKIYSISTIGTLIILFSFFVSTPVVLEHDSELRSFTISSEDDVFRTFNIPLRTSCMQPYTSQQDKALKHAMNGFDSVVNTQPQLSLWERWSIDGEIMHDYEAEKKDYDEQMND